MSKYARRRDANHSTLCDAFRTMGCSVFETDRVGEGFPDVVVGVAGKNALVELKNPKTYYGKQGLNTAQSKFAEAWRGGQMFVVATEDDVIALVSKLRHAGDANEA